MIAFLGLRKRQPCLEFIETHLPEYHKAFANPYVRFNTSLGHCAPISEGAEGKKRMKQPTDNWQPKPLPDLSTSDPAQRPFWERMLPKAMAELKAIRDEPSELVGTTNSIRDLAGWAEIVNVLDVARARTIVTRDSLAFGSGQDTG